MSSGIAPTTVDGGASLALSTEIASVVVLAFAVAFALTPVLRDAARSLGLLDVPNDRSSHTRPTPRTGGLAVVSAIYLAVVVASDASPAAGAILALSILACLLGLIDDLRGLPAWFRLLCQTLIASAAVSFCVESLEGVALPGVIAHAVAALVAIVWITAVMNAFNFMDGINGMAASQAIICGTAVGLAAMSQNEPVTAAIAFATAAAALGFLPWNIRGTVFLGDAGSLTLGFLLALLILRSSSSGLASMLVTASPLLPFLLDTGVTLVRRAVRREPLFRAHRTHFYQRLVALGWSHAAVTGLWSGLAFVAAVAGLAFSRMSLGGRVACIVIVALAHVATGVLITVAERQRTRSGTSVDVRP